MSLFENGLYRWRETYFILFEAEHRPTAEQIQEAFESLGDDYEVGELKTDEEGNFELLSLYASRDFAAMDISFVSGDEINEQVSELRDELLGGPLDAEERAKLDFLPRCTARFDIYHFEQVSGDDDDEVFDPGGLLLVLEALAGLCDGVAYDPQTGTFV